MSVQRKGCLSLLALTFSLIFLPLLWREAVKRNYSNSIYRDANMTPRQQVAIVFGAAVYRNNRLSTVLRDRMDTAIELYESRIIDQLLVSGAKNPDGYDEPSAMMAYALQKGVPPNDVIADYGGRRTYDTCYRARHVFGFDSAILVTQEYHLPRALFTCEHLGLEAVGLVADKRSYRASEWYEVREKAATFVALWDVITNRQPAVLGISPAIN